MKNGNVKKIYDELSKISWTPPYEYASLTDHEIAISSHLFEMSRSIDEGTDLLYTLLDAFIDYMLISGIKQACYTGKNSKVQLIDERCSIYHPGSDVFKIDWPATLFFPTKLEYGQAYLS